MKKIYEKVRKYSKQYGVLASVFLMTAVVIGTTSVWIVGIKEAPEDILD